jgi:DNA-binding NarL/FixJ family response regulator
LASETNVVQTVLIALADDDSLFRGRLAEAVHHEPDLRLLQSDLTSEDTVSTLERECPDVLLLAAQQDHAPALAVLEKLHAIKCATKIVLLVSMENQDFFVRSVRLGCRGILQKESPTDLILKCIRKVNEGELWLDRATTALVLRQFTDEQQPPRPKDRDQRNSPLSPREREIVTLVIQGFKNKELAEKLLISEQTVKNHMHNIFDKLGVSDRLELALYALHNHLVDPISQ